jgi:aconitate hydratase
MSLLQLQVNLIMLKTQIMGIKLIGKLPDWVSAKDLFRNASQIRCGGRGYILEYYGPGLKR